MQRYPETLRHGDAQLTLDPTRLLVYFEDEETEREEAAQVLERFGLRLEGELPREDGTEPRPSRIINHVAGRFWARAGEEIPEDLLEELEAVDDIDRFAPVYHEPGVERSHVSPLPSVLLVRLHEQDDERTAEAIAEEFGLDRDDERSEYLRPFGYYEVEGEDDDGQGRTAYPLRERLLEFEGVAEVEFELMPMVVPLALSPNDTHFGDQWDMVRINAPGGWDLSTGDSTVSVAVIDSGCDLGDPADSSDTGHPDLNFDGPGFNANTLANDGRPDSLISASARPHGTSVAGIAAAMLDNSEGVAGVSGACEIHAVALRFTTNLELATGINEAANTVAVDVINLSVSWPLSSAPVIDPAITNANGTQDVVLCAATGNGDISSVAYPARHPDVIAVGASDQNDERKRPTSPDGECWWGSNWGPETDVVAPGVLCWSTDFRDADGYNDDGDGYTATASCGSVTYPTAGDAEGDYISNFNGTSAATPHVAGLAALIRSHHPSLSANEVRQTIERTAEKVSPGTYTYAVDPSKPNGTWNTEMGYGRINVGHALDFADAYVRDHPTDDGSVPFGGTFWHASDLIVRRNDDDVFAHQPLLAGQDNYIYVRVTNLGPATARNVHVSARAVNYPGTEFVYPHDWVTVDPTHIVPAGVQTNFVSIPPGGTEIAKFRLSASQVTQMAGWHPCLLTEVESDNDYGTATGQHVWENNDLAQRNVSIETATTGSAVTFPFVTGHRLAEDTYMELVVDRSRLPDGIELLLDPIDTGEYFEGLDLDSGAGRPKGGRIRFPDRTRLEVSLCGCDGVLTLQGGSTFECSDGRERTGDLTLDGGEFVTREGERLVSIDSNRTVIGVPRAANELRQMSLRFRVPDEADVGEEYRIDVSQRRAGVGVVGGVTLEVEVEE